MFFLFFFLFLCTLYEGILKRVARNKNRKFYRPFNAVHQFNVCHRIMTKRRSVCSRKVKNIELSCQVGTKIKSRLLEYFDQLTPLWG